MSSAIYTGWVWHRRLTPKPHGFRYRVFMPYLNLDELPELFDGICGWSARRPSLAWFRRKDFLGDPDMPLKAAVQERIFQVTGKRHRGSIYLLANLRYFGYIMNPIACYYCFSEDGQKLEFLVAEVTNTPWNERHSYVLDSDAFGSDRPSDWLQQDFEKEFHVSPFQPMNMCYHWRSNTPGEKVVLHLANSEHGQKVFKARLVLERQGFSKAGLNRFLLMYPFMTARIALAIYWQALRLWLKGMTFYPHPKLQTERLEHE